MQAISHTTDFDSTRVIANTEHRRKIGETFEIKKRFDNL